MVECNKLVNLFLNLEGLVNTIYNAIKSKFWITTKYIPLLDVISDVTDNSKLN